MVLYYCRYVELAASYCIILFMLCVASALAPVHWQFSRTRRIDPLDIGGNLTHEPRYYGMFW